MKDRFPRTVAEFAEHNRRVVLHCEACRGALALAPEVLVSTFGPDFDLYSGLRLVRDRLSCGNCGAGKPRVSFYNPEERSGPVSFDKSVTNALEFNAYVRASADGPLQEAVRGPRSRRR